MVDLKMTVLNHVLDNVFDHITIDTWRHAVTGIQEPVCSEVLAFNIDTIKYFPIINIGEYYAKT